MSELFFLWEQVLFKELAVPCRLLVLSMSLLYPWLHRAAQHLKRRRRRRIGKGACLREGMLVALEGLLADTSPVTVLLKICRSPNRQRQAAVFKRAAAVAAARCCLCHTARASGVESIATTQTRGWISHRPGLPTRRSCRDSGNRELPLRLRTWKTSWRWMAWPWSSVCHIRQAWSTGKREAELDSELDTPKTWTEGLRTSRWEQLSGTGRSDTHRTFEQVCVPSYRYLY